MKKIAVVTATRAEYGLLLPLIRKLREKEGDSFKVDLIVTGTHLSKKYGMTINDIYERIDHKVKVSVESETDINISENQAETLVKFTGLFHEERYNAIVLLGDRYEALSIAIAAGNTRTPIFHLCGGDTTEGALDEWIRHSITKMSYLHFVTNEESRHRVIQLGEDPSRVYNYGSTSIDNIMNLADMSKEEALSSIGLKDCNYILCTYHPVTMETDTVENQIEEFLNAINTFKDIEFIVTKSNADQGGARINELLDAAETRIHNLHVYTSLGVRRYLSLMKYSDAVVGNSSSGIIETPAFHVPTVNIGDRQRGRLQAASIINCGVSRKEIEQAIRQALSVEHKVKCRNVVSFYGDGHSADKIANEIYDFIEHRTIDLKKKFYDCGEERC